MMGWWRVILVLVGALAVCTPLRADMVPLSAPGGGKPPAVRLATDPRPAGVPDQAIVFTGMVDLRLSPVGFLPHSPAPAALSSETKPAHILADRQDSLTLCLYALLGLGLGRSAPLVKKFHVRCIPDWYHCGGPSQIGHSFAISPDCLPSAPVLCLLQPGREAEDVARQYSSGAIAALLRKAQFTPTTLASRGPPHLASESPMR